MAPGADLIIFQFVIAAELKGNYGAKCKFSHDNRNFNHNLRKKPEHSRRTCFTILQGVGVRGVVCWVRGMVCRALGVKCLV